MTSFLTMVNEGLIELPKNTRTQVREFIYHWYLAYLLSVLGRSKDFDDHDREIGLSALKVAAGKLQLELPEERDVTRVSQQAVQWMLIHVDDLPDRYVQRIADLKKSEKLKRRGGILKIEMVFKGTPPKNTQAITYHRVGNSVEHEIFFYPQSFVVSPKAMLALMTTGKTSELTRLLKNLDGLIDHELTHVIQDAILRIFHRKQSIYVFGKAAPNLKAAEKKNDHYLTSDVEFDPWIKTSIEHVRGLIKKHRDEDPKEVVKRYTCVYGDSEEQSKFFKALKRSDPVKWKKAVKILSQAVL